MKTSRLWIYSLICRWLPETRFFGFKVRMLRWCGAKIGDNVRICSSAYIAGAGDLDIGDNVWIGEQCFISPNARSRVEIGANCDIGPCVMILNGSHEIDVCGDHIAGRGVSESVVVSEGSWLGARSVILPGVNLPAKTIVAAGSVVVNSPSRSFVLLAGTPAVEKKYYDNNN